MGLRDLLDQHNKRSGGSRDFGEKSNRVGFWRPKGTQEVTRGINLVRLYKFPRTEEPDESGETEYVLYTRRFQHRLGHKNYVTCENRDNCQHCAQVKMLYDQDTDDAKKMASEQRRKAKNAYCLVDLTGIRSVDDLTNFNMWEAPWGVSRRIILDLARLGGWPNPDWPDDKLATEEEWDMFYAAAEDGETMAVGPKGRDLLIQFTGPKYPSGEKVPGQKMYPLVQFQERGDDWMELPWTEDDERLPCIPAIQKRIEEAVAKKRARG